MTLSTEDSQTQPTQSLTPVQQCLLQALQLHQTGQIAQAIPLYRQVIESEPDNVTALAYAGLACLQQGETEEGVALLGRSIALNPNQPNFLNNRGAGLRFLGRLDEARQCFEQAFNLVPDYLEAYHNHALVLIDMGRYAEALPSLERAIALAPDDAELFLDYALALQNVHREDDALNSCERALSLVPDSGEAHFRRALLLQLLGRYDEALVAYEQMLAKSQGNADIYHNRGIVLKELGRLDDAIASYRQALQLRVDSASTYNNLGVALQQKGDHEGALQQYDQAIALKPDYAEVHYNRAMALHSLERYDEALTEYDRAIDLGADTFDTYNNRGNTLKNLKRYEDALRSYERAITFKPDSAEARNNCAAVMLEMRRYEEALKHAQASLQYKPNYPEALLSCGIALQKLRRWDEALHALTQAIEAKPGGYPEAEGNKSMLLLMQGDYKNGWPLYEWRWRIEGAKRRELGGELWLGEQDIRGKTVLIHAEQGLGDNLQFCRYALELLKRGANVVYEVPAILYRIMRTLNPKVTIVQAGTALPSFDYHCPVMSLPYACRTELHNVPAPAAYLGMDESTWDAWQYRLIVLPHDQPRVGLVWSGNARHSNDEARSIPLATLQPLFDVGIHWHCLQKEIRSSDRAALQALPQIKLWESDLRDLIDTAAVISAMDVVLTVDTSIAHLAAAMGKPTWILLAAEPDFRWMLDREDSPWYPSVRLFRQPKPGDWDSVLTRVKGELQKLAKA